MAESTKDEIRSRVASTVQSASIRENNLTREEQRAIKRLKNNDIVITKISQTPISHATYIFFLWVAYIQTFQTLDSHTATTNQQITTQTI